MSTLKSISLTAAMALVTLLLFSPASASTTGEVEGPGVGSNLNLDSCSLTVSLEGRGAVSLESTDGESLDLAGEVNSVSLPCGEEVTLRARPFGRWQFDHWLGVTGDDRYRQTITIAAPAAITAVFSPRPTYTETLETPYYRAGELITTFEGLAPLEQIQGLMSRDGVANAQPQFDIWYGTTQNFGSQGTPQEWINILGNVRDDDGIADIASLTYKLNTDPTERKLSYGGIGTGGSFNKNDGRRLFSEGDFNVEIDKDELLNGPNKVVITATDKQAASNSIEVTVNYNPNTYWPIPYDVAWTNANSIQEKLQVVDGKWSHSANGVKTVEIGYDRILALGQGAFAGGGWTEFEVEAEVTIHSYDEAGFDFVAPAVGLVARWQGHTDLKYPGAQPKAGWVPVGAVAWYSWKPDGSNDVSMWSNGGGKQKVNGPVMAFDQTYWWKVRVENVDDNSAGTYYWKIWKKGTTEPEDWLTFYDESMLEGDIPMLESGSILLLAHFVDVTFGEVHVRPVGQPSDTTPPVISNVAVIPQPNGATISWKTNEAAKGKVDVGTTTSYGITVAADQFATEQSVFVPGLSPALTYHFQITATDLANNSGTSGDATFATQQLVKLVSDDFNACELGSSWTFVDPLGAASYVMNTEQLEISVPAGLDYNIWPKVSSPTNRAARIMRDVTEPHNARVKFETGFGGKTAMQGLLVEQDAGRFLRAGYHYKNGKVYLAVIGYDGAQTTAFPDVVVSDGDLPGPLYLWLERVNGHWWVSYSTNGADWTREGPYDWPMSVTKMGVFAGNFAVSSDPQPQFLGSVDFVFDTQNPILPEDAQALILPVAAEGGGTVSKDKDCGNPVTLTAVPNTGWVFDHWEGSPLAGQKNPIVTTSFAEGQSVKAIFVEKQQQGPTSNYLPLAIAN